MCNMSQAAQPSKRGRRQSLFLARLITSSLAEDIRVITCQGRLSNRYEETKRTRRCVSAVPQMCRIVGSKRCRLLEEMRSTIVGSLAASASDFQELWRLSCTYCCIDGLNKRLFGSTLELFVTQPPLKHRSLSLTHEVTSLFECI